MTLQQPVERRPKKIDLNLLPAEFRPAKKSILNPILFVTILLLVCAIVILIIMKSGVSSKSNDLQAELNSLAPQLSALQTNKAQADALKVQINAAQNQLTLAEADDASYRGSNMIWSEIIAELDDLIPKSKITIDSITSTEQQISMSGTSSRKMYVYDLVVDLNESEHFYGIEFNFGDCPDISSCTFSIKASVRNTSQMEGGVNE